MDTENLQKLAVQVSSPDIVASREAVRDLKSALSPSNLLAAWQDEEHRTALVQMLAAAEAVGNADVYAVLAGVLEAALSSEETGPALLAADVQRDIPTFLLRAMGTSDISLAYRVRPAVLALMKLTMQPQGCCCPSGGEMGGLVDSLLDAEKALRLFDCDAAESEENLFVYTYLQRFTTRLAAIGAATVAAFDTDPLLLANYLVVSGIIGQRESPGEELVRRVEAVLDTHKDELAVAFVGRYCSIALFHKEENAAAHAERWVRAALAPALLDGCGEDAADAVLDLAGSASTTRSGWHAVVTHLPADWMDAQLRGRSVRLQLSVLRFQHSLLLSPYVDPTVVAFVPLLRSAWQLRSSLEEPVRVAVWDLARAVVGNTVLREHFAASYASFLCGAVREDCVMVRERQLRVAAILDTASSSLPEATKLALGKLRKQGLYPPGSVSVASMRKD